MSNSPEHQSDTERLTRRNRELSILNTIVEALNREVDLSKTLQITLAHVAELCNLQSGWIWLMDETTGKPYLAATQHLPPALADHPRRMDGSAYCYCLETYESGDLEGAANISIITCSRLKGLVEGTDGLRYHATIPLFAHEKQLGVLNVASKDWQELAPDDLRLLYTVGDLLSMAIERAHLFNRSIQLGAVEERNRLAREFHDTLAQGLTGITLQLEAADALADVNPDKARQYVQKALQLTRYNLEEARRSVLNMRATPLEGKTLQEALHLLAEDYLKNSGLQLNFFSGDARSLPLHIQMGLYRITQEALTNIVRHAQAKEISISLRTLPHQVELIIDDDGCGFDYSQVEDGHYGLIGLNERVNLLNGKLRLCSTPGDGTSLEIIIPMQEHS